MWTQIANRNSISLYDTFTNIVKEFGEQYKDVLIGLSLEISLVQRERRGSTLHLNEITALHALRNCRLEKVLRENFFFDGFSFPTATDSTEALSHSYRRYP